MLPSSFAPMLLKLLMPKLMDHFTKVFKLDKVLNYVEQPNELDKKVKSLDKKIKKLEKLAHPAADFVCTDCGTKAKKVKDKMNKIKERF